MHNFYTNVQTHFGKILFRGVMNGNRVSKRFDYRPCLFVPDEAGEYQTIKGKFCAKREFSRISEARKFIREMGEIPNFPVYGMRRFEYPFINEHFSEDINFDINKILVARIDIEVMSDNGFPEPERADDEITAITIKLNNHIHVFGIKPFIHERKDLTYYRCADEIELIEKFMSLWTSDHPDIVTGWFIEGFDIPYLINRIGKVMGEDVMKKLSPWGEISEKTNFFKGREQKTYNILGVAILDSIELYKRYSPKGMSQDSYALDNIGLVELKERKTDYSAYGNLNDLYKKNPQLYYEYNIQDVELDEKIAKKYDVIRLALTIAYMNKVNYEDIFKQVRMWAAIVDRTLLEKKIVLDHNLDTSRGQYSGGFVKEPVPGMYDWIVSFDLNSLYPHLIMQYNISPETLVEPSEYTPGMRSILNQSISVERLLEKGVDTSKLKDEGVTLTPNKQLFRTDKRGFLPEIMQKMYDDRKKYKKMQIEFSKQAQVAKTETEKERLKDESAKYKSIQEALKVCLNSAYGALGSEYFVIYDTRMAEAITSGGRLSIQWVGNDINQNLQKLTKTTDDFVLAQDTDSMYLVLEKIVNVAFEGKNPSKEKVVDFLDKICEDTIQKMIDKSFIELKDYLNAYEQKMFMKRENIASMGVWTGKKRYFLNVYDSEGVRYKKPEIKITGLEPVRSSVPITARNAMKKCYKIIAEKNQIKLHKFIARIKRNWHKADLNRISFPVGVNGLDKYSDHKTIWSKGTPEHVRACLIYNHLIKENGLDKKYETIKNGNKIRYVYMKEPNPLRTDVIAYEKTLPTELEIRQHIDYRACYEKAFGKPMDDLLSKFGWTSKKTNSLDKFFM